MDGGTQVKLSLLCHYCWDDCHSFESGGSGGISNESPKLEIRAFPVVESSSQNGQRRGEHWETERASEGIDPGNQKAKGTREEPGNTSRAPGSSTLKNETTSPSSNEFDLYLVVAPQGIRNQGPRVQEAEG